ncbi:TDP-N-acetylfucosamine:lipid II N-acetylfucosaminyltransferase [Halomonas sp. PR-M31]|uniref:TDP-N-acetylfucosamine:lipid II N-acetylfucosaminyltransferase n=1 Tax=Halomonas sp. PR-M31 TaxID=1471202 RepID=UPI000A52324B|nr:TDP-N-acetylfucosamine:lipid II N-acetylfucosaminyltransferase [Halomonas sp. PR-M31]
MDKFIPAFMEFVREEIDGSDNHFHLIEKSHDYPYQTGADVEQQNSKLGFFKLYFKMRKYDKIILHGLFNKYVVFILALNPKILGRCYWIIWGGDLYSYQNEKTTLKERLVEWCRRKIIPDIGHLVTYIPGDIDLARQWYGAKGSYIESFVYPSNLYKSLNLPERRQRPKKTKATVLVGNSASRSNEHCEAFERLKMLPEGNIKIICPLSYGNRRYARKVMTEGERLFSEDFIALTEFLPLEEYLEILAEVDIACFAFRRQQAMGNMITLLGSGKTVFIRKNITPWSMFEELGVKVFDLDNIGSVRLDDETAKRNREIISSYFSKERLIHQLKDIL